jgi:hypothetical protein
LESKPDALKHRQTTNTWLENSTKDFLIQRDLAAFAGHCWRSQESTVQPVSDLLFWTVPGGTNVDKETLYDSLLKDHVGEKYWKERKTTP